MSVHLDTIYSYFQTGDSPTEEQFRESWSSFWHKYEAIPINTIAGLENQLQNKADKNIFETHVSNPESHINYLAKKDASNLDNNNIRDWKTTLGVGEMPENVATIDDGSNTGSVYTKNQSDSKYMFLNDFVNDDRKILAEKIEALGLTNLIESAETSISDFADHADAYQFEDNDFIAVPDVNGNFSLYMFKGGEKKNKINYLPTGISNITAGMVEGLQDELNKKINKPSIDGKFYIKRLSGVTTTEVLTDETLASVVNRNNYSPKGISFFEDTSGSGNPGANAVLGANKNTYSFFFGNMNPAHTGVYNIALGYSSLPSITSGEVNTIIGHYAGKDITTGSANVAIGQESATGLSTGKDNTLIGNSAGYGLKNGSGNSMLGKWTGCFIAGNNNTFLGYQAGQFWGRGGSGLWSSNIVIGAGTSGHSNGIWGENNLIIGSNIELIGAQSNKFIINNFLGKDNNYYKTHFIEGNFADRWLRFDTSLQVLRLPVADTSFTKDVVARPDGTFGLDDKKEYIPLKGTVAGKPVTGEIEFSTEGGGAIKSGVAKISVTDGYTTIFSGDPAGEKTKIVSSPQQIAISQGSDKYINLTKELNKIDVGAPANGPGVVGKNYYGDNYDDNSFVQKKWVDQRVSSIDLQKVLNNGGSANTDISQVSIDILGQQFDISFIDYADLEYTNYRSGFGHNINQTSFSHSNSSGSVSLNLYKSNDSITFNTATYGSNSLSSTLQLNAQSALTYGDDYSSKFTNRSLVDKEYVDNEISSYIPLDGTKQGKPLNGDIQINPANYETRIFCQQNEYGGEIIFRNTQGVVVAYRSPAAGFYPKRDSVLEAGPGSASVKYQSGDHKWRLVTNDGGVSLLAENADGEKHLNLNTLGLTTNALFDIDSQNANEWTREVCQHPITGGLGFKKKKANILKSIIQITNGTFEPTFVNLENELGNIVWTRTGVGEYIGKLANAFPIDKFWANAHISTVDGRVPFGCRIGRLNDNQVYLSIFRTSEGNASDIAGNCGFLEINVFN